MPDEKNNNSEEENIDELKEKLEECEKEKEEYLNGWKRSKADFINYKNKEDQRIKEKLRYRQEEIMEELITVMDSFKIGLSMSDEEKMEKKGVELIFNQLKDVLKRNGLERIKTLPGDEFNPEIHEAMEEIKSEEAEGKIAEIAEEGYKLKDKILRPVKVKIAKNKGDK